MNTLICLVIFLAIGYWFYRLWKKPLPKATEASTSSVAPDKEKVNKSEG